MAKDACVYMMPTHEDEYTPCKVRLLYADDYYCVGEINSDTITPPTGLMLLPFPNPPLPRPHSLVGIALVVFGTTQDSSLVRSPRVAKAMQDTDRGFYTPQEAYEDR